MSRVHLFELEDQPWFPAILRDAGTAYLRLTARISGQAPDMAAKLAGLLRRTGSRRIVDLCSGAAGPLPAILEVLSRQGVEVHATLTDRYPNLAAFAHQSRASQGRIDFVREPLEAASVPERLSGVRTLFNALHHFRPDAARAILQSAVSARRPIAIFEAVGRHPVAITGILFAPLTVLVLVPFLRPFRPAWIPLTYLVPLIPLFVLWDGLVSCLRVYSPDELRELIAGLSGGEDYQWEIDLGRMGPSPVLITSCLGWPREAVAERGGDDAESAR